VDTHDISGFGPTPRLIALLAAALLAACSDAPGAIECNADDDCSGGAVCVGGLCGDAAVLDLGDARDEGVDEDPATNDLSVDSLSDDVDVDAQVGLGGFGEPCEDDEDCDSRYCIDSDDGPVCTQVCDDECPTGWACRLVVTTGGDAVEICVPESENLCRPCTNDNQCGSFQNFCLEQENGRYCATDCAQTRVCPDGYGCNPHTLGSGDSAREAWLCEPLEAVCRPFTVVGTTFNPAAGEVRSGSYRLDGVFSRAPIELRSPSYRLIGTP